MNISQGKSYPVFWHRDALHSVVMYGVVNHCLLPLQAVPLPVGNSNLNRRTIHRYASGQLHIRRRSEKSTIILVSIVMIFLTCHFFRLSVLVIF